MQQESYDSLVYQARIKAQQKDIDSAIALCSRAIALDKTKPLAFIVLGLCHFGRRDAPAAIKAFQYAIYLEPKSPHAYHNLGLAFQLEERVGEAMDALRKAVDLAPQEARGYSSLCELLLRHGMAAEAVERLSIGLRHNSDSIPLLLLIASAYAQARSPLQAEEAYRRAIAFSPTAENAYGFWLQEEGRFEESFACFERSLQANPKQGFAYYGLLSGKRVSQLEPSILEQMRQLSTDSSLGAQERMYLCYALGKALDQSGDYEPALRFFDEANSLVYGFHNAGRPFDDDLLSQRTELIKQQFSAEELLRLQDIGSISTRPIFIVGMIRSGTTLLEQILSSHSMVGAAGELRFWMEEGAALFPTGQGDLKSEDVDALAKRYLVELDKADSESSFVSDKMPLNFEWLGLIHSVFPNGKILHIRRNPVDTCLSIYMTYLGPGSHFAYHRGHIVSYYREYLRIMEHWRSVLPPSIFLEVDYEDLVADPESNIRRIIEFCGLPWEKACLHHEQNKSSVNTPSRWQARQPIYKSSLERWRRYEPWLGEFAKLIP